MPKKRRGALIGASFSNVQSFATKILDFMRKLKYNHIRIKINIREENLNESNRDKK